MQEEISIQERNRLLIEKEIERASDKIPPEKPQKLTREVLKRDVRNYTKKTKKPLKQ